LKHFKNADKMDEESVKILKIWKDKTKNGDKEILKK